MKIRRLLSADIGDAVRLARAFHAESAYRDQPLAVAKVVDLVERAVQAPDMFCIVLVDDVGDHAEGYLMAICHEHYFSYTKTVSDLGFYITPAHRNAIIARAMIDHLETWAFTIMEAHDIALGVSSGVADAAVIRFYQRLGYSRGYAGLIKTVDTGQRARASSG